MSEIGRQKYVKEGKTDQEHKNKENYKVTNV